MTATKAIDADGDHPRTGHLVENLTGRTISGGLITATSQGFRFALDLGTSMILARLLAPEDFGLVGMAGVVILLLNMFSDMGLTTATIQAQTITPGQSSNLFWINVCLSGLMGCVAAVLSPAIAWFYHDPRLVSVSLVLALTFPFAGLAMQHRALLNRQLRFKTLGLIEVGSMLVSVAVGCSMALLHYGYWSLVGMQLSAALGTTVLTWCGSGWRPQLPRRNEQTRPLLRFGLGLTAGGTVSRLARQCDTLLLGKFWGATAVGLYSRASVLLLRPLDQFLSPISAVMLPVLSRLQDDPERYRRAFLRTYNAIGLMSFPVSAIILAAARPLVLVILGAKWEAAISLFSGFTAAALYIPLATASTWLLTSQGRSREMLKANLLLSALVVLAFLIGLPYGPLGMVLCFSVSGLLLRLPLLFYLVGRRGPVTTLDLWKGFLLHIPSWVTVYAAASLACAMTSGLGALLQLLVCSLTGVTVAVLTVWTFHRQRQCALQLIDAVKGSLAESWRRMRASRS